MNQEAVFRQDVLESYSDSCASESDYYQDSLSKYRGKRPSSLSPVIEVAPGFSCDLDDDVFIVETKQGSDGTKENGEEMPQEPRTSKRGLSTAEVIVALSERRRSTAANVNVKKSAAKAVSRIRKSTSMEPIDPLRANLELLYECCGLIQRNQRQLLFNFFLILLVAAILSSMIIFATLTPPSSKFQLTLTPWALFLPVDMTLRVSRQDQLGAQLLLSIGESIPSFSTRQPSYCKDDISKCTKMDKTCWCFDWRAQATLHVESIEPVNSSLQCLSIEWTSLSDRPVEVSDCFWTSFSASGMKWYGGPLTVAHRWPLNYNVSVTDYKPYLVNDIRSNKDGIYGVAEPLWVSDNGFGVLASLDYPFLFNQSDTISCLRSLDITKWPLKYMVCSGNDPRLYTRNLDTLHRLINTHQNIEFESRGESETDIAGTIFVNFDASTIDNETLIKIEERMDSLKFRFGFVFENYDLFDQSIATRLFDVLENVNEQEIFEEGDRPIVAVEVNNFVKFHHLEGSGGEVMRARCVRQSLKDTIGVSKWRNGLYAALDFTKTEVSSWFMDTVSNRTLNTSIQTLIFAGGDANTLPGFPSLNVSNDQSNYYSTIHVRLASSLPMSVMVGVGYGTQETDLYVNLVTSPNEILSLIPLILSVSLQGYSKFSLTLFNYSIPGEWWRPTSGNTDPLYTWLELAMFTPVFRIPPSVMNWTGFDTAVKRFLPFREPVIMEHYKKAHSMYATSREPIFKPVWWRDYQRYQESVWNDEQQIWLNDRQFMIGDDLLVASFLQMGEVEQLVYLPPGRWRNPELQEGALIQGGKFVYIDTIENVACFERVV